MTPIPITAVHLTLADEPCARGGRVVAYASIGLAGVFAVHSWRVVATDAGRRLVAAPTREARRACPYCGRSTPRGGSYCCRCGAAFATPLAGRRRDVAHPTHPAMRAALERAVLAAYDKAVAANAKERKAS